MALRGDIRDLADRSLAELDASHNDYVHTKAAWRLLQKIIVKERRRFSVRNTATGTVIDETALHRLSQQYVAGDLASSTFQQFVSLFESYLFDLLRLWLAAHPGSLARKQIEFGAVLNAPDRAAIIQAVVDKQLYEIGYGRVSDWFEYLDKVAKLGCPTPDEIGTVSEIKATRDILVHNKGIANPTYVSKSGTRARYREGERVEIPEHYHRASWELIRKLVRGLADAAILKA